MAKNDKISPDGRRDLETVRNRLITASLESLSSEFDPEPLIETLRPDGSWPNIDYEDVSRTGFRHADHLSNMLNLSRAFRHPGSSLHRDPSLRQTILSALDFWIRHDFLCENWWWNEMGTPDSLADTFLLLGEELSPAQKAAGVKIIARASLDGFGARPGGDLIKIAGTIGKRALIERDAVEFDRAVATMASEVRIGTGRGVQPDMSLQHRTDRVTSTLTYGAGYAGAFTQYAAKLRGTRFAFPEEALELLIDFYLDGIHKSMAHGLYREPSQLNRGITRSSPMRPVGAGIPKGLASVSNHRNGELQELIAVRERRKEPAFRFNKYFWNSEYLSHQRPAYFASVRMYSSRNHSVESPYNEEGLRNHYLADGSTFVIRTGDECADVFGVYDWRKIPGTTVVQKPSLPAPAAIPQKGITDFVGGASDGDYGAAVFDFESPLDSLKAKKAWFFFDREFVSLGAGISSDDSYGVATTINQTALRGEVAIRTGRRSFAPERGEHSVAGTTRVWHDNIAYLFPVATDVSLKNTAATGNRRNISRQPWATDEEIERDTFTLWIDHGKKPRNADYAYIVVPKIAAHQIADYEAEADISILANTTALQAVTHRGLGQSQIVFHKPGQIKLNDDIVLTAEQPCLVILRTAGSRINRLTVADPARKHPVLNLRINRQLETSDTHWTSRWDQAKNETRISIDLPKNGYAGQSRTLTLP